MARRGGLGNEGFDRINRGLTGQYPMQRFPWDRTLNYPGGDEKSWNAFIKMYGRAPRDQSEFEQFIKGNAQEEAEAPWYESATLEDFIDNFYLDFDVVSPVMSGDHLSSRVASMQFKADNHVLEDLKAAARKNVTLERIGNYFYGDIHVTWTNGKTPWKYNDVTYSDYLEFKQSDSKGKYLNENLRTNHGPA